MLTTLPSEPISVCSLAFLPNDLNQNQVDQTSTTPDQLLEKQLQFLADFGSDAKKIDHAITEEQYDDVLHIIQGLSRNRWLKLTRLGWVGFGATAGFAAVGSFIPYALLTWSMAPSLAANIAGATSAAFANGVGYCIAIYDADNTSNANNLRQNLFGKIKNFYEKLSYKIVELYINGNNSSTIATVTKINTNYNKIFESLILANAVFSKEEVTTILSPLQQTLDYIIEKTPPTDPLLKNHIETMRLKCEIKAIKLATSCSTCSFSTD